MAGWIEPKDGGVVIRVHAQPGAGRSEIQGLHGEPPRLKIRIGAPPVDGKANEELLDFLKKKLGVTRAQLALVRGETSRQKDVFCAGLSPDAAQQLLFRDM